MTWRNMESSNPNQSASQPHEVANQKVISEVMQVRQTLESALTQKKSKTSQLNTSSKVITSPFPPNFLPMRFFSSFWNLLLNLYIFPPKKNRTVFFALGFWTIPGGENVISSSNLPSAFAMRLASTSPVRNFLVSGRFFPNFGGQFFSFKVKRNRIVCWKWFNSTFVCCKLRNFWGKWVSNYLFQAFP